MANEYNLGYALPIITGVLGLGIGTIGGYYLAKARNEIESINTSLKQASKTKILNEPQIRNSTQNSLAQKLGGVTEETPIEAEAQPQPQTTSYIYRPNVYGGKR